MGPGTTQIVLLEKRNVSARCLQNVFSTANHKYSEGLMFIYLKKRV
jgi:hypothetical protein